MCHLLYGVKLLAPHCIPRTVYLQLQQLCSASLMNLSVQGVSPDGQYFVTGGKKGALHKYQIPDQCRSSMPAEGMEAQVFTPLQHAYPELHAILSFNRLQSGVVDLQATNLSASRQHATNGCINPVECKQIFSCHCMLTFHVLYTLLIMPVPSAGNFSVFAPSQACPPNALSTSPPPPPTSIGCSRIPLR